MILMYFVMAVLAVLISFYLYFFIKRICKTFGVNTDRKLNKTIIGVVSLCLAIMCSNVFSFGAIIILHIIGVSLLTRFANMIIRLIAKNSYKEGYKSWKVIYGSGIIPVIVSAVLLIYGYINMNNVVETDYTVYTDKAIREEGYRVALLADVHYGVSLNMEELREVCEKISERDVDIVVLCGDIVDDNTTNEEMRTFFEIFSSIKNRYGIFYVYGNHDRQLYRTDRAYTESELRSVIEGNGIIILEDDTYPINNEFTIVGREDASYGGADGRKSMEALLKDVNMDDFILTLDHQPKKYEENGEAGTDLLLSGHTHGGQIWPANILFEIVKFDDAVYGYTAIDDDTQAIVTSGLAGWGFPVKTASPAEYVIIDIKPR